MSLADDEDRAPAAEITVASRSIFGAPGDARVRRAIRILEDAAFPTLSAASLAHAVGMSEFHFSRVFHAEVGKTWSAYVRDMCLGQAAFRLKSSDAAIQHLFSDYGYSSQAAFTRAFTARFGVAPATFRAQVRSALAAKPFTAPLLDVRLHRRSGLDTLLQRYVGPPEHREAAWRAFAAQVAADGLGPGRWIGLMHDDPMFARPEDFRFDLGFAPARRSVFLGAPERYERFRTTAGVYGTVVYRGPYQEVGDGYGALLRGWLQRQKRFVIAGEPLMEAFASSPLEFGDDEVSEVEISIKLSAAGRPVNWWEGAEQRVAAEREWRIAGRRTEIG